MLAAYTTLFTLSILLFGLASSEYPRYDRTLPHLGSWVFQIVGNNKRWIGELELWGAFSLQATTTAISVWDVCIDCKHGNANAPGPCKDSIMGLIYSSLSTFFNLGYRIKGIDHGRVSVDDTELIDMAGNIVKRSRDTTVSSYDILVNAILALTVILDWYYLM
ncbi:hypothetical protein Kpol_1035p52 [Vanderwaltozyma polyspora DSM 70294]|uniref:Uncharacterized protein n=1 Tax=Vanderwaltozyma polyspora (strain ATCC 22028 / DSM 70294 / BCRC 21397 / CBS 2163 / NBRC 10782 / NRRL Y-8283 / UCD 57-17) TaxID=436907 RepID=A7TKL6_VANPO|nr:uncharacterized protein Kpol_1035p52 [Vanderwaltozyma polyspora DSM 70294]EDO17238.1 hypothetical protein Kpol_1035p52 [Vanderwaltozyma polyspora DSM 70294]